MTATARKKILAGERVSGSAKTHREGGSAKTTDTSNK